MPKVKKPAPKKGGAKKAAPKKKARKSVTKLTERQADQRAADKMRADSFASTVKHSDAFDAFRNGQIPAGQYDDESLAKAMAAIKHPTVEEQHTDGYSYIAIGQNEMTQHTSTPAWVEDDMPPLPKKPSLWSRFRSAVTGLFVSKKYAEANPDTTVRERVK